MANNVAITPGSGDTVAAEDISSVKYQLVKLVDATAASVTRTGVAANPLQVSLANHAANATAVKVDGSAVTQPVSAASLPLPSGAATSAKQDTGNTALAAIQTAVETLDNTVAGNELQVDVLTMPTTTVQATNLDIRDLTSASDSVAAVAAGDIAHDSADSGNPLKLGAKAENALSGATLVADGDRTNLHADLDGALITKPNGAFGDYVSGTASNTDGASTQVLAAGAAGVKHYITDVTIANTSASNIYVELKDDTTAKWVFPVPANGGVTHTFRTPLAGTAATAWNFDPSAAATTIYCSVSGFKSKV